ncbi:hypothetical protein OHC33_006036 [Knufia fluminis]|uniref:Uncharacterized protein n=1 Tax=Knufia fluminis TaxID=191047 RepID=A0AAN8EFH2_9EURO|nr:hypothetical protein OHC33_006036 [Knufia fluminis]
MASNNSLSGKASASAVSEPWRPRGRWSQSRTSPSSSSESLILAPATNFGTRGRNTSLSSISSGSSATTSTTTTTTSWGGRSSSPTQLTKNGSKLHIFHHNSDNAQRAKATNDYKEAELSFKIWLLEKVIEHHNSKISHFRLADLEALVDNTVEKREALKAGCLNMEKLQQLVGEAAGAGVKLSFGAKLDLGDAIKGRWYVSEKWFVGHESQPIHDEWTKGLEKALQILEGKVSVAASVPAPRTPEKKRSVEELQAMASWR